MWVVIWFQPQQLSGNICFSDFYHNINEYRHTLPLLLEHALVQPMTVKKWILSVEANWNLFSPADFFTGEHNFHILTENARKCWPNERYSRTKKTFSTLKRNLRQCDQIRNYFNDNFSNSRKFSRQFLYFQKIRFDNCPRAYSELFSPLFKCPRALSEVVSFSPQ